MRRNIRTLNGWQFHAVILLTCRTRWRNDTKKDCATGLTHRPEGSHSTLLEKGNEIGPGKEDTYMHVQYDFNQV